MTDKKTLKEAAFCIGVHWRTLYQWTLLGKIEYIQHHVGSPIYIPDEEIERITKEKANGYFPITKSKIYFLQAENGGLIKIGFTQDIESRLVTIRGSSPIPLKVLAIIDGDFNKEAEIHEKFNKLRKHGEWFEPALELIEFIKNLPS